MGIQQAIRLQRVRSFGENWRVGYLRAGGKSA